MSRRRAGEELLKRRQARRRFLDFVRYVYMGYQADPFHELVADTLDRVVGGEVKRLIIMAPPQHGKSLLTSVLLPAYWLAQRPHDPVIISSYAANLAHSKSREARQLLEGLEYRALFGDASDRPYPIELRQDSRAVDEWYLAKPYRGGLRAVGVGGGLTGFPGMLGIIDDPIANWQEAQSLTIRDRVWEWYRSVFRTRIWEGGAIVIIQTRWHEDDLTGRLLNTGEDWEVLRLPALAETQETRDRNNELMGLPLGLPDPLHRQAGEPLAPQRFSDTALADIQTSVGSVVWGALYQGAPRAAEGNRFKRDWFPFVSEVPFHARRIRYWDKGGTDNAGAYTAGVLMAYYEGILYVEDVVREQMSAGRREKVIRQTAELDAQHYGKSGVHVYVEQEPGSGGKESAENTIRNLAGFVVYADRPTGNKDTRMEPFAAQAEAGNVRLKRGHWNQAFIEEAVTVPNSTYRDQIDAASGAVNRLFDGTGVAHRRAVFRHQKSRRMGV
jgi:predicted phage terminase large subunit-like protein